jgi:hypothetical protein
VVAWLGSQASGPRPAPSRVSTDDIVQEIGDLLAAVARDLDGDHAQRRALADHFFCGLLAELANAIQIFGDAFDQAIEEVVSAVMSQRLAENRSPVSGVVVRLAVHAVVAGVKEIISRLALMKDVDKLQRAVRILAILMCPAPEKHRAVVEYCIDPLEQPIVSEVIRRRLQQSLPGWLTCSPIEQVAAGL